MSKLYDYVLAYGATGQRCTAMWMDEYHNLRLDVEVGCFGPGWHYWGGDAVRAKIIQALPRRDESLRCRLLSSVHAKPSIPPWELHGDVLHSLYHRDFGQDPGPVSGGFRDAMKNLYWFELYGGTVTGRMKLSEPAPHLPYARREGGTYTAKLSDVLRQSRAVSVDYAELERRLLAQMMEKL